MYFWNVYVYVSLIILLTFFSLLFSFSLFCKATHRHKYNTRMHVYIVIVQHFALVFTI